MIRPRRRVPTHSNLRGMGAGLPTFLIPRMRGVPTD